MAENMDLTARQLYCLFKEKFSTIETSMNTIKRARLELGVSRMGMQASEVLPVNYRNKQEASDMVP